MAFKGGANGGCGKTADEVGAMQDRFVEAVVDGAKPTDAAIVAGYADREHTSRLLSSQQIHGKIVEAFKKRGIDFDWVAAKYAAVGEEAFKFGAKDKDLGSMVNALKNVMYALSGGKLERTGPQVAVQINNQTAPWSSPDEQDREIAELLREEVRKRQTAGVPEERAEDADAAAHPGMGEPPPSAQDAVGGGGS